MSWGRLALVPCALLVALGARASDFVVDSTADAPDALPGDGACADASGACTLRAAVMEANALSGADRVTLGAAVHSVPFAVEDDAARTGDLDVLDDLEVLGAGAGASVIEGAGDVRLIELHGAARLQLTGVTLRGAHLSMGNGAALRVAANGTLVLERSELRDNTVGGYDLILGRGAALALESGARATLRECTFLSNRASDLSPSVGGAIWADSAVVEIEDTLFAGNTAMHGGAIDAVGSARFSLVRCRLENNAAVLDPLLAFGWNLLGGGVHLADGSELAARDSTFRGNSARDGGALQASGTGPLTLERCWFDANRADDPFGAFTSGGAIDVSGGSLVARQCAFTGNTSTNGMGGALRTFARAEIENCTFSGSSAATLGAALALQGGGRLAHCTIAGNPAGPGTTALWQAGRPLALAGCVVAGSNAGEPRSLEGSFALEGPNLIDWLSSTAGLEGDVAALITSLAPAPALDVALGALADNGGPTPTHALLLGSPALDAGLASCPAAAGGILAVDQRGFSRPEDGDLDGVASCDLGAFEQCPACGSDLDGDGVRDDLDCAPSDPSAWLAVGESTDLRVAGTMSAGEIALEWATSAVPATWDVASDSLPSLHDGGDGSLGADGPCVLADLPAPVTVLDQAGVPSAYYLVRARNACGAGSWGASTLGAPRPACP